LVNKVVPVVAPAAPITLAGAQAHYAPAYSVPAYAGTPYGKFDLRKFVKIKMNFKYL